MAEKVPQFTIDIEGGKSVVADTEKLVPQVTKEVIGAMTAEQKAELAQKLLKNDPSLLEKKGATEKKNRKS